MTITARPHPWAAWGQAGHVTPVTTQVQFWGGRPGAPKRVHEPSRVGHGRSLYPWAEVFTYGWYCSLLGQLCESICARTLHVRSWVSNEYVRANAPRCVWYRLNSQRSAPPRMSSACLSICLAVHSILTLFVSRPNVRASRYQHVDALRRSVKPPLRGRSCPSSHAHAPPSKRTHQLTTERAVRCARHSAGCSSSRHQAEHVCTFMPRPAQRPHSTL